jgi:hypothetical protein
MRPRTRNGALGAGLAITACAAALVAPSTSSALRCHAGFTANQGVCVKKPPAGVPKPGFYTFNVGKVKIGMEVRYETQARSFKNKFVVLVTIRLNSDTTTCTPNSQRANSDTLKSSRVKIVAKKFSRSFFSALNSSNAAIAGQFVSATKIKFAYSDKYTIGPNSFGPGGDCTASGATTGARLHPATKFDVL